MNEIEKILIADDEPVSVMILRERLEMDGYQVGTASSGEAALEQINRELPERRSGQTGRLARDSQEAAGRH